MSYDPVPTEWLALDAFLVTSIVPWAVLVLSANGFKWKLWWEKRDLKKPMIGHPMMYSLLFLLICVAAGVAAWFVWREGFRSDNIPPNPSSGNIPSNLNYFLANIFYLVFWIMACFVGPCFFIFSLEMKYMVWSCILSFLIAGLAIALTVMGFLIWFVPGIIFLVVAIFCCFQFLLSCMFYKEFEAHRTQCPSAGMVEEFQTLNIHMELQRENTGQPATMPAAPPGSQNAMRQRFLNNNRGQIIIGGVPYVAAVPR